jgi:hypothetical protein
MYVIHTNLIYADGEKAVYAAQVCSCRWVNKQSRRWSGKFIRDTGDRFTLTGKVHSVEARAKCDELSRQVAARLGANSGPDTFPFA